MKYDVEIDDLTPDLRELVDIIGLQSVLNLIEFRGGESIYIQKAKKIERSARDRLIHDEFNGNNYKELARKYNLTIVRIRQIVDRS